MTPLAAHTLVACLLIVAYVIVTVTGGDGNVVIGLLAGQGGGAAVQKITAKP
jgi:hypothetical protein